MTEPRTEPRTEFAGGHPLAFRWFKWREGRAYRRSHRASDRAVKATERVSRRRAGVCTDPGCHSDGFCSWYARPTTGGES